ncbi:hypothetical protein [Taibaiella soli]|uniref:NIPSNAP domain-containing protein n=1 Tax=Taibaiella soli TaxID=1649169 RepID=A0A2W2ASD8_9BACT|nr:hypothetical protein [Taibaiella soli]PZF70904.1 hypothetical protein DN068_20985 [Taibaiella soli]
MYIVRDIFQLKFGHFKDVKKLFDNMPGEKMMPDATDMRVLSDFTGDSYRLILEAGFKSLQDYEKSLSGTMGQGDWQQWYGDFKQHVESSHREILKQVF